jgi:hypothetical protein
VKNLNRCILRCLLFFYLSSSYLSAIHIHNDALEPHNDCKVCLISKNLIDGNNQTPQFNTLPCNYCYEPIKFQREKSIKNISKGFDSNAPPLF